MRTFFGFIVLFLATTSTYAIKIESFKFLDNREGYYVHHDLPLVSLDLFFKGGAYLDPKGKEGRDLFTASLLNEGAGPYDSKAFNQKLDELASTLTFSSTDFGLRVHVKCLEDRLEETLKLVAFSLFEPRFDADAIERVRAQMYTQLKEESVDPNAIASKLYATKQYPNHTFSRFTTKETIAPLKADDFKQFLKDQLGRDVLIVGVVAKLPKEKIADLLGRTLTPLPPKAKPINLSKISSKDPGGIAVNVVDRPQTVCLFGHRGIERNDPDYYPSLILNALLGGIPFTSRLFKTVRVEKGLTYGITTNLTFNDYTTQLSGTVATDNNRFSETYETVQSIWEKLRKDGPTQEEVTLAKDYMIGSFALNFQSSESISGSLISIQKSNLGLTYFDDHLAKIKAVTFDQVKKVASKLLTPDNLTFVCVGNPKDVVSTPKKGA